jgi:hypothetical protein
MNWKRIFNLAVFFVLGLLLAGPGQAPVVQAGPDIFASPVQAGCYLARHDRCKIHVEPYTINIASGQKLVQFRLVTIQAGSGIQKVIYDWRPDQSNPVPFSGTTYSPSPVAKDFGASCGSSYTLSLQGKDSGDANMLNLGFTGQFTCPTGTFFVYLPVTRK